MLALTVEIPDWLFNGAFWAGFATATVIAAVLFIAAIYAARPFR